MFALIISGTLALNRALIGRWSVMPLFAIPLLYNFIFLVGLMNYIFGIGVALWALAGWIAVRERAWPLRFALTTASVAAAVLLPSLGAGHLRHRRAFVRIAAAVEAARRTMAVAHRRFRRRRLAVPGRCALALCQPDHAARSAVYWDQRGKIDGLMYVSADYSDIAAFGLISVMIVRHGLGDPPRCCAFIRWCSC